MSLCPINGRQCCCQPDEGMWCINTKTPEDHCKVYMAGQNEINEAANMYRWLQDQHNGWHVEHWVDGKRPHSGTWLVIRGHELTTALRKVMKERSVTDVIEGDL